MGGFQTGGALVGRSHAHRWGGMVRPAGPDIWVQSLGAMACAPLREPGTVLSEGGIRGPAPEKVFRSVPFCAVSYVVGGTPGNILGRFWRTNGRQMDAFGTKWNGLLGGVGGGAAVYLLFRSRTYNSTKVRGDQGRSCACGGLGAEWGGDCAVRGIPEWLLRLTSRYAG